MDLKSITPVRWAKFVIWALLYTLWVIWLGNYWWLLGLVVVFDVFITQKVHWNFWKKRYKEGEKISEVNEWLDAVIFALIVVTFINTFFVQAFKIPSSSMERTLFTGDHLFVSKLTYGPRLPQTPLTIPFTHNVAFGKESYSTLIQNDYRRLRGFRSVERGDRVVFCFPDGDTVLRQAPAQDYYEAVRTLGRDFVSRMDIVVRPADKKDHYVKRCVAVAGDSLEVRNGFVWVNGEQQTVYPGVQFSYKVRTNGQRINSKTMEALGLKSSELYFDSSLPGYGYVNLTAEMLEKLSGVPGVENIEPNLETDPSLCNLEIFPYTEDSGWTRDFFGPLWIPKKGVTVKLDSSNVALYSRLISTYENEDLNEALKRGEYTFKQDYFFMMGDNRHNSLDSRYFGFVPEDHIVGRPVIVWLSTDSGKTFPKNIRWRRFLKLV